ncbi:glycine cleavage system protein GcvH [Streptomyces sp. AP-93]|uniref:glycine cleavage system protein GcvH n=1 Tax=Streptomyces sp. AP-93 TaxID=2929048 RepID=UPI001FAF756C|nr:glycine cleavage system protein GcvH [Streptomyces sp. AP-93]MCJ0870664.1 glycine cleavage system protein GcvH [Streptomyces sp. AP-93]
MNYPTDLRYSRDHEWIRVNGGTARIGITDFAQKQLGDLVYVEQPSVGGTFDAGEPFGSVESVKAVTEVYSPVAGEVVAVNEKLNHEPELINDDPYGDGWLIEISVRDGDPLRELMTASQYEAYLKSEE